MKKMPKELITFLDNKGECAYYYCVYTLAYDKFTELKENNLKDFMKGFEKQYNIVYLIWVCHTYANFSF